MVEAYVKEQSLFLTADAPEAVYTEVLALDLATVEPSLAGLLRPPPFPPSDRQGDQRAVRA